MTPEDKEKFWDDTVKAAKDHDPRFMNAVVTALVLRYGDLKTCAAGCHTYAAVRLTIEELRNVVDHYNLGRRARAPYCIELTAISREYTDVREQHGEHFE